MRPTANPQCTRSETQSDLTSYARRGRIVRIVYLAIALAAYVLRFLGAPSRTAVVVLCYHGVTVRDRKRFAEQMRGVRGRAVSSGAIYDPTAVNESVVYDSKSAPRVCIMFDDAFANLIENAVPVTSELGIPITIFVPTSNLGRPPKWPMRPGHPETNERIMKSDEIRQVHRPGLVDFGSHTMSHANLALLPGPELSRELVGSRQALAELLGEPIRDLALPYGAFNEAVLAAARAAGYSRIFTLEERTDGLDARGACGRFLMSADAWPIEFRLTCAGAYGWLYGWRRFWRGRRNRPELASSPSPST